MTHTPGPWTVEHEMGADEDGHEYAVWAVHSSHFSAYIAGKNDEADAYLIAAAPDLLKALKGLWRTYGDGHSDPNWWIRVPHWTAARDAIAKATGETA